MSKYAEYALAMSQNLNRALVSIELEKLHKQFVAAAEAGRSPLWELSAARAADAAAAFTRRDLGATTEMLAALKESFNNEAKAARRGFFDIFGQKKGRAAAFAITANGIDDILAMRGMGTVT